MLEEFKNTRSDFSGTTTEYGGIIYYYDRDSRTRPPRDEN